jgi:hypothetical protein
VDKLKLDSQYKIIFDLSRNITRSGKTFCAYLVEWLDGDAYKRHWDEDRQKWHECETFAEFMEASPARGLGLDPSRAIDELKILSSGGVADATTILTKWIGELENPLPANGAIGNGRSFDNIKATQGGTSTDYTLRRLARDGRRELLSAIEKQEISVNQAAIAAGYRKKKSPAELVVANFRKCENRLEPLRVIVCELDEYEVNVLKDFISDRSAARPCT